MFKQAHSSGGKVTKERFGNVLLRNGLFAYKPRSWAVEAAESAAARPSSASLRRTSSSVSPPHGARPQVRISRPSTMTGGDLANAIQATLEDAAHESVLGAEAEWEAMSALDRELNAESFVLDRPCLNDSVRSTRRVLARCCCASHTRVGWRRRAWRLMCWRLRGGRYCQP